MKPYADIVLVQVEPAEEKTASGFYIKEDWKTLPCIGTVLAIGPDVSRVQVGDRVLFERYAAVVLRDNQRFCKESHIMAQLEETDAPG